MGKIVFQYQFYQGCSLDLDVLVSTPVFEMSRSRLVDFVGRSRLGFKVECIGLVSVSGMKVSFAVNIVLNYSTTFASFLQRFNQLSSLTLNLFILFTLVVQRYNQSTIHLIQLTNSIFAVTSSSIDGDAKGIVITDIVQRT